MDSSGAAHDCLALTPEKIEMTEGKLFWEDSERGTTQFPPLRHPAPARKLLMTRLLGISVILGGTITASSVDAYHRRSFTHAS